MEIAPRITHLQQSLVEEPAYASCKLHSHGRDTAECVSEQVYLLR